jgi:hypothetical protein
LTHLAEQAPIAEAAATASASALTYQRLEGNPIDASFKVSSPILCHVGPDADWPVLKPFIEGTSRSASQTPAAMKWCN